MRATCHQEYYADICSPSSCTPSLTCTYTVSPLHLLRQTSEEDYLPSFQPPPTECFDITLYSLLSIIADNSMLLRSVWRNFIVASWF